MAERILNIRSVLDDLTRQDLLSSKDFERILTTPRKADDAGKPVLTFIAEQEAKDVKTPGKILSEDRLSQWLAIEAGISYYHIDPLKVNAHAVTEVMSYAFAQRHKILAVEVSPEEVVVACTEPYSVNWVSDLEHVSRRTIRRVIAQPSEIQRLTIEFYSLSSSVSGASAKHKSNSLQNLESMLELGKAKAPDANDEHIVTIVDWLLQYAFEQRASDIHIEPRREESRVRFRIDGVLHKVYEFPGQVGAAVTSRIKTLGRMNVAEKRRPQDSRLKTKTPEGSEVELRLSTMPTAFGEKLVMRIFDPDVLLKDFSALGFGAEDQRRWGQMTSQNSGIVFVTGPTGSGKTTTLYSTLKHLATDDVNVCTIEDPIEMVEPAFNQMQVQSNIDLSFSSGVRTLLRQDPDIIMVGEIRDLETANMAIQAALTGHLVLTTLHTNDAASAVTRLLELGVPHYLIKSTVLGIMAQRLVRILCSHCKAEDVVNINEWNDLVRPWKAPAPEKIYKPVGCLECRNTGFAGRAGIYEVLSMSETIAQNITVETDFTQLRSQAMKEGMRTLRLSGAAKVANGLTTISEILRVSPVEL
jgi:general secretion pathway protein E